MKRRYPLETLRHVKSRSVDDRATEVGDAMKRTKKAAEEALRAAAERHREEDETTNVAARERARLEDGESSVADLARAGDYTLGAEDRVTKKRAAETCAEQALLEETERETEARDRLTRADADAKAVEKHRDKWQARENAAADQAEDEAAEEVWNSRRRG